MKLKTLNLKFSFIIIFFLVFNVNDIKAQEILNHEFVGNVFIKDSKAKGTLVKIFDNNKCISEYITSNNGKFIFTAESEKYYTIQFEKEGYVTKRIVVKTFNTSELDYLTKTYKFDVNLVKMMPATDYSHYDFPMAIFELDFVQGEFNFNETYTNNRLKEIAVSANTAGK
jgi:hypothetical protein